MKALVLITIALLVACTTTYSTKELPHPKTGDPVKATIETSKFLGFIPVSSEPEYPEVPKTDADIKTESKERIASWGTIGLAIGIPMAVLGVVLSLMFSAQAVRIPQYLSVGLLAGGATFSASGLIAIGFALHMTAAIIVTVLFIVGVVLYLLRNKGLKWPSHK